ncbi:helix-turn-helix domain-containing protein [Paraburkholderia acidipaludis]|uniref:helix-turn-helix domain-containing protein n=1 Tax=Paraburkholderia acidipaludis TaxID=660537 RepID=UPI0012ECACA6|nr:helix-turn-helix domain-containing protein [Paraburkholderia acidipaludis]
MESRSRQPVTYQFSTLHAPPEERFDAWAADCGSFAELYRVDQNEASFDLESHVTVLGPFAFPKKRWLNSDHSVTFGMRRPQRRIRRDGLDYYFLQLQLSEARVAVNPDRKARHLRAGPGDLFLVDEALPMDVQVTSGDSLCLMIQRDVMRGSLSHYHMSVLKSGLAGFLADYLKVLHDRLRDIDASDAPRLIDATTAVLRACLQTHPDAIAEARTELDELMIRRVKRYIDDNLFDPNLNVDRICKAVGIARSSLYQLFESAGGIARTVRHRRLRHAHDVLASTNASRVSIAQVAWRHGFEDAKHFSRCFKEQFGYTPSEAREARLYGNPRAVHDDAQPVHAAGRSNWMNAFVDHT